MMTTAHRLRMWRWWISLGLALLLAGWPEPVAAHNPAMSLSPTSGPVGTPVIVSVTGFDPDRDADVFWNFDEIGTLHIGPDFAGSMTFNVPGEAVAGNHRVDVLCLTCQPPIGEQAYAWFEVTTGESTIAVTELIPTATDVSASATPLSTATFTCEQAGSCTPTANATPTPLITPSPLPSSTDLPASTALPPPPSATFTCEVLANCTATPTPIITVPPPRPSATRSVTPTTLPTVTHTPSPSFTPIRTPTPTQTLTITPPQPTTTPGVQPPASVTRLAPTPTVSPTGTAQRSDTGWAFPALTILLGSLVILLGALLSGMFRWPRRGR